jgi:DNA ligase D-like protein (predicted 3'-phosphoesterase)
VGGYRVPMTAEERLTAYRVARRAGEADETSGASPDEPGGEQLQFVVQRHDARSLHFDVRLEIDGVLVSWAVPKGPSLDPADKRLAHRTEDHSLSYIDFEGRIGEGYGAGTVIVWDIGTYDNLTVVDGSQVTVGTGLASGHLKVLLHGHRLRGAFAFIHTRAGGDDANWILVKVDDEYADRRRRPTFTQNRSVLTGVTNEDLEQGES